MQMTKLFTTVFDEEMLSRGFKRKNSVYYSLCGEILQGIRLKTLNPYIIRAIAIPYWMIKDSVSLVKGELLRRLK